MALLDRHHKLARLLPLAGNARSRGTRAQPECVVLGVREGVRPSSKPPVRIFVGTEPDQYRAERVFFWSIEQVRDPGRIYEIHLMKELVGFDQRGWLTAFTNYRFAIPHFAAGSGKAIYNDVDQVYLGDPGELFDVDLGEHGFLALSDEDTSVMLIDCARMACVWTLSEAQRRRRSFMEAKARTKPDLWGALDPKWHARDTEYVPHHSKLLHYTAIHMQPWQPTPDRYAYQHNPVGEVWNALERAADAAGYQVFTAAHPSQQYKSLCAQIRQVRGSRYRAEKTAAGEHLAPAGQQTVSWHDLVFLSEAGRSKKAITEVVSTAVLDCLPDEDIPWVLDELFRSARRKVTVTVETAARPTVSDHGIHVSHGPRSESWWVAQLEAASRHHPEIHWQLIVHTRNGRGRQVTRSFEGGRRFNRNPTVWVLTDNHPGNTTQSLGLAKALGWPYELKALRFTRFVHLHDFLFGMFGATRLGLQRAQSAVLAPPWPDLVITTGWRTAHIARWIKKQNHDHTRLVQMGRKGTHVAQLYDLAISCRYFRLPPDSRRIEILVPLTEVSSEQLRPAPEHGQELFADTPRPRIALLVGGSSYACGFDEDTAHRLGVEVRSFAEAIGGSVFATTSRRTGPQATVALKKGLGDRCYVHEWQADQSENPYRAYLALADILIVTGESESMLAEAAATGKPFYIYPLPKQQFDLWTRLKEWIVARGEKQRFGHRGTIKPQRGLQYLCARLVERGIILPQPDLHILHETLVGSGIAQFFGSEVSPTISSPLREVDDVARRVRRLMGMPLEADVVTQPERTVKAANAGCLS
ncbi:MAG TPA: ELM1/GtrOC1 family putative glycosyltransferase [Candidatus Binatia bacterium]